MLKFIKKISSLFLNLDKSVETNGDSKRPNPHKKREVRHKFLTGSVKKVGKKMVHASSIGSFVNYSESSDKSFLIAWSDSDRGGGRGGCRESGDGSYVLAQKNKLILNGNLQRPQSGKVANNGTFIVNDWMFDNKLNGTFYAFDNSGLPLVEHLFSANLINNGISEDGKYAVCQCANSETEDSGVLSLFNLETGKLLMKKKPESGQARSYNIDTKNNLLYLDHRERGNFRYTFDGKFIDKEKYTKVRLQHTGAFGLSDIVKEHIKGGKLDKNSADEFLVLLNNILKNKDDADRKEQATAHRAVGEIYDSLGNLEKAIQSYESAINLNSKIGAKRRLTTLKKLNSIQKAEDNKL